MNIQLTPDLEQLVRRKLDTGQYSSVSEVIPRCVAPHGAARPLQGEVRAKIVAGLADQLEGRVVDGEAVFDEIETELDALED